MQLGATDRDLSDCQLIWPSSNWRWTFLPTSSLFVQLDSICRLTTLGTHNWIPGLTCSVVPDLIALSNSAKWLLDFCKPPYNFLIIESSTVPSSFSVFLICGQLLHLMLSAPPDDGKISCHLALLLCRFDSTSHTICLHHHPVMSKHSSEQCCTSRIWFHRSQQVLIFHFIRCCVFSSTITITYAINQCVQELARNIAISKYTLGKLNDLLPFFAWCL